MTNRDLYFKYIDHDSPYINSTVIRAILAYVNDFESMGELLYMFEDDCKNPVLFDELMEKCISGVPYQYVIHSAHFHMNNFYVDERVLIPRNETEELTEMVIELIYENKVENGSLIDMCCGSGCIGLSLKKIFPNLKTTLLDVSSDALDVAKYNAERLECECEFVQSDMFTNLNKKGFDILVCNPPYIESEDTIDELVLNNEPKLALMAKPDTKFYEIVFQNLLDYMNDEFIAAFEIGENMTEKLTVLIEKYLPGIEYHFEKDLYGKQRFLFLVK